MEKKTPFIVIYTVLFVAIVIGLKYISSDKQEKIPLPVPQPQSSICTTDSDNVYCSVIYVYKKD